MLAFDTKKVHTARYAYARQAVARGARARYNALCACWARVPAAARSPALRHGGTRHDAAGAAPRTAAAAVMR